MSYRQITLCVRTDCPPIALNGPRAVEVEILYNADGKPSERILKFERGGEWTEEAAQAIAPGLMVEFARVLGRALGPDGAP